MQDSHQGPWSQILRRGHIRGAGHQEDSSTQGAHYYDLSESVSSEKNRRGERERENEREEERDRETEKEPER